MADNILNIEVGKTYRFDELEKLISKNYKQRSIIRVYDIHNKEYAMMFTFGENFTEQYQSGHGLLLYTSWEEHSSNGRDEYRVEEIIPIYPKE